MTAAPDSEGLKGKVVLVTGSACGLGAALVRAAAQRKARVVINCRENQRRADALGQEIQKHGGEALVCRADVTEYDQARGLVDETTKAFGRVDVLVNAVGAFTWKPIADTGPDEWRRLMASNLDSVYQMSRLVLPSMRTNHWGRIVNLGAVGAERSEGQPKVAAYSAAKAAVVAFSKSLALEEARSGITVNVVSPGVLGDGDDGHAGVENAYAEDRIPVGRSGGPEDLVRAVMFFCSPAADFLTGQVLAVAGGWRL